MSKFTLEQIEFIERTINGLNVSGALADIIRVSHVAEGVLDKLSHMRKELSSLQPEADISQNSADDFRGILKE